ncbi:MFS transporter [Kineococcus auxinigenes]|uniref:MFS transporter n=1 Tax=unclassified Kineococcus TaxID=2621656 RepID=UPI003D7DC9F8
MVEGTRTPEPSARFVAPPRLHGVPGRGSSRRALVAASVGNVIEWYDFVLYGASAFVLAQVFFPQQDPGTAVLATFATFGVAFLARPVGALVLSHVGDRVGRRDVLAGSVLAMALATALIAVLPTHARAGLLAPALLLVLRAVQGFCAGGEYGGSATFLVEYAPEGRRGWFGAWQTATIGIGSALATVAVLLASLSPQTLFTWGWRVPFALALPLGLVGLYLRLQLEETPEFQRVRASAARTRRAPAAEVLRSHRRPVLVGAALVSGATLSMYVFQNYVPTFLATAAGVPLTTALGGNLVGIAIFAAASLLFGRLSDATARRPFLLVGAVALVLCPLPAYLLDVRGSFWAIALGQGLFGLAVAPLMGLVPAVLAELFPTPVRFTGLSISYTLANALLGGTAPLVVAWLFRATGSGASFVWYCSAAALISLAGALLVRETGGRRLVQG